jgi:hypothetical protein
MVGGGSSSGMMRYPFSCQKASCAGVSPPGDEGEAIWDCGVCCGTDCRDEAADVKLERAFISAKAWPLIPSNNSPPYSKPSRDRHEFYAGSWHLTICDRISGGWSMLGSHNALHAARGHQHRAASQTTRPRRKRLLDAEKGGAAVARRAGSCPETVIHGSARRQPVRKRSLLFDRRAGWCVTKPCADDLLTGSELSLTVPITNSLAFLFTVLGEWIAEGKSISKGTANPRGASRLTFPDTWIGMALVLSGIAICVRSKS